MKLRTEVAIVCWFAVMFAVLFFKPTETIYPDVITTPDLNFPRRPIRSEQSTYTFKHSETDPDRGPERILYKTR